MSFRERLTYRLLALLVVLGFTLLWVLGRDIQIGDNTFHPDAIAALLVALGAVGLYMFPQTSTWVDKPIFGAGQGIAKPDEKDPIKTNREELLKAVDQTWISGLLDHLLNQQESLNIGLEALEPDKLAQRMGGEPYPLTDNQAVLQTFKDFGRKLVLLGKPGAGKTVLMLQLARLLWNAAKREEHERIPMVFPLASWAAKQLSLEQWLSDELQNRYGTSDKLAKALVEGEQIIFLLDGLDEVAQDYREDCLKAIKAFVEDENRHVEYVLCSRRKEFEELETRLEVPGEIFLKPLTTEQINTYLKKDTFATLRGLLNTNDIVRNQFATIPFMLNTMAYVTRGQSAEGLRRLVAGKNTEESLRATFLDEYVTQRLAEHSNAKYSDAKQTRHWLKWLAGQLIKHDETDFYLENMQVDWLNNPSRTIRWQVNVKRMFYMAGLLIGGAVGALQGAILGWVSVGTIGALVGVMLLASLVSGLLGLLVGWLIGILDASKIYINMNDQIRWIPSRSRFLIRLIGSSIIMLLAGLLFILFYGPLSGLLGASSLSIIMVLLSSLDSQTLSRYRAKPGQGIQRSLKNALIIMFLTMFVIWPLLGILLGQLNNPTSGLLGGGIIGLLAGFLVGANFGFVTFIQHYTLRWMLAREGNLPSCRYDKFLDYANELVILRKVGGGYPFTHDYLRQHLAGTSTPKANP